MRTHSSSRVLSTWNFSTKLLPPPFLLLLLFSVIIAFLSLYAGSRFFPNEFLAGDSLVEILSYYALTAFSMIIPFFWYTLALMTDHRKTRLSFRVALVGLKLISRENSERGKLVRKYIRWLKDGFRSYNRYLYNQNPARIEVVDIDDCYHSLSCVALMGNRKEINIISEQIRLALNSLPRSEKKPHDVKQLLIRLKNIKEIKRRRTYPLSEINDMTRIVSFSDRLRTILTHPYLLMLIAVIIPILTWLFQIWSIITNLGLRF